MGHEAAGVVADNGANVTAVSVGERVTFDSTIYCGVCHYCRSGRTNLCDDRRVLGVSCREYRQDGAFAEYVAVPRRVIERLPDRVTFEQATMVEPLSVALHAVRQTAVSPEHTAVVVGAGMIGLLAVQALRAAGCGPVIAVDVEQERLELACRLGAAEGLQAGAVDISERVRRATGGLGADLAVEAVGTAPAVKTAIDCVRKGGSLVLIGNVSPTVELPLQAVVTGEVSLVGSCASAGEYPECLDMIARGAVNVDALISAVAPLAEGAAWFARLYSREPGLLKVILMP
jgi:L-iditol 2-dehydrogenase